MRYFRSRTGRQRSRSRSKNDGCTNVCIRYVPISFLLSYGLSEASCISYPKLYTAYGVLLDTITPNTGVLPTVRCYPSFLTRAHGESIQILHEVKPYAQYLDLRNDYFLRKTK